MFPTEEAAKVCPNCGGEPTYIEQYKMYYCYTCEQYIEPVEKAVEKAAEVAELTSAEDREYIEPVEKVSEKPEEPVAEPTPAEDLEVHKPKKPGKRLLVKRKKAEDYRYRTRILKGSILPILYGVISFQMLNKYVYDYPDFFKHETMIILAGFLLGFGAMLGITIANLVRAKKNPTEGYKLTSKAAIIVIIPFLIVIIVLAFFLGISTAWQFSMGFFLAAIFPIIIVTLYEVGSKGKFFVREVAGDPSEGRKLVFVR